MAKLSAHLRGDIRLFAFFLANRTVAPDLLSIDGDDDYRPNLVTFGSELEMVFAIFTNVLAVTSSQARALAPERSVMPGGAYRSRMLPSVVRA